MQVYFLIVSYYEQKTNPNNVFYKKAEHVSRSPAATQCLPKKQMFNKYLLSEYITSYRGKFLVKNKGGKGDFLESWEAMLSKCINQKKKKDLEKYIKEFPQGKLCKNLLEYFE